MFTDAFYLEIVERRCLGVLTFTVKKSMIETKKGLESKTSTGKKVFIFVSDLLSGLFRFRVQVRLATIPRRTESASGWDGKIG